MADVGTLTVRIQGDTGELVRSLKKAGVRVRNFSRRTETSAKKVNALNRAFVGLRGTIVAIAGAAVVGKLVGGLQKVAGEIDNIAKVSRRIGVSTEFLSEMRFAASQSGVAFDQMAAGLERASKRFGQIALTGRGEALEALEALGGGIAEAVKRGESFESLSPRIADALRAVSDEQQRLFITGKIFGDEGRKLIQIWGQGADAIEKLRDQTSRTFTDEEARRVEAYNDAMDRLSDTFGSIAETLVIQLAPAMQSLAEWTQAFVDAQDDVDPRIFKFLGIDLENARQTIQRMGFAGGAFGGLGMLFGYYGNPADRLRDKADQRRRRQPGGPTPTAGGIVGPPIPERLLGAGAGGDVGGGLIGPPLPPVPTEDDTRKWEDYADVVETSSQKAQRAVLSMSDAVVNTALKGMEVAITRTGNVYDVFSTLFATISRRLISWAFEQAAAYVAAQSIAQAATITTSSIEVASQTAQAAAAAAADSVKKFGIIGIALGAGFAAAAIAMVLAAASSGRAQGRDFARGGIALSEINNANIGETARARPEVIAPLRDLLPMIQSAVGNQGSGPVYLDGEDVSSALMPRVVDQIYFAGGHA